MCSKFPGVLELLGHMENVFKRNGLFSRRSIPFCVSTLSAGEISSSASSPSLDIADSL